MPLRIVSRPEAAFACPRPSFSAAAARAVGIPAKLGYADVRNHLTSPRLAELMRSDVFRWHGYTALFVDGRWLKATPAFDAGLCVRFGVKPLEFDGTADFVFHAFDVSGRRHMEYLREIGEFDDFPYEPFAADMRDTTPISCRKSKRGTAGRRPPSTPTSPRARIDTGRRSAAPSSAGRPEDAKGLPAQESPRCMPMQALSALQERTRALFHRPVGLIAGQLLDDGDTAAALRLLRLLRLEQVDVGGDQAAVRAHLASIAKKSFTGIFFIWAVTVLPSSLPAASAARR